MNQVNSLPALTLPGSTSTHFFSFFFSKLSIADKVALVASCEEYF